MISIVIPAHKEEKRIQPALSRLVNFLKKTKLKHELILVADNEDNTRVKARKAYPKARFLIFQHRIGKGEALSAGFRKARGHTWMLYDADGATPPEEIRRALAKLQHCDVVIGSRRKRAKWYRVLASYIYNLIARFLFGLPFKDTQCGFKVFSAKKVKDVVRRLRSKGFEWDLEFLYACKQAGLRICELPIQWKSVPGGPIEANKIKNALKLLYDTILLRMRL